MIAALRFALLWLVWAAREVCTRERLVSAGYVVWFLLLGALALVIVTHGHVVWGRE